MRTDRNTRTVEQEVAAGRSETTPLVAIGTVIGVIAVLFAVALTLVVVAYVVA